MKKLLAVVALLVAVPLAGATQPLFEKYEAVRQALLTSSIPVVQKSAKDLAVAAKAANQNAIAARAESLARSETLKDARNAFAAVSDEIIKYRDAQSGDRPSVAYCSMEKKSWLQPKGAITNPYVASGMRACGEFKR